MATATAQQTAVKPTTLAEKELLDIVFGEMMT